MTTLKIDTITFTYNGADTVLSLSGSLATSGQYAAITGFVDPTTQNVSTTGAISGSVYKTSGNVAVISDAGAIAPYGLYTLASGVGTSGQLFAANGSNGSFWETNTSQGYVTTAVSIALGKC